MNWVVKLTRHGGQYRITLPRELIFKCGFEEVEFVRITKNTGYTIKIEEYYGKRKEKRDIPEDRS